VADGLSQGLSIDYFIDKYSQLNDAL